MESQRRPKVVKLNALPPEPGGFGAVMQRWGNTALTVLLIGAIIWLGIRWRAARAEQNRMAILSDLTTARTYVQVLENEPASQTPDYLARSRAAAAGQAGDAISLVLNTSDDPKLKAEALIARGDLDWELANFPELPGAATQPALQLAMPVDQYLSRAAEAYQQVLSGSEYASQHGAAISARFGLAAIAENRHQWEEAAKQLQAVADDAEAPASLKAAAQSQLAALPTIQTPLYLSSSTQPAIALAAAMPATRPAYAPIPQSAWKLGMPQPLAKPPVLLPATQPAMAGAKLATTQSVSSPAAR